MLDDELSALSVHKVMNVLFINDDRFDRVASVSRSNKN